MRFRNDTRYPILIRSSRLAGYRQIRDLERPNGRTVTWTAPSDHNVVRGFDTVQSRRRSRRARSKRIEWPVDGKDVASPGPFATPNGRVIHRDTFVSHYHRMVGITLIGR